MPAELAAVVARMMAKDPARRFQTPGEVAEALTPFFKRSNAADASPRVDISRAGAAFDQTDADPQGARAVVSTGKAAEASVAESRWESLVKVRDDESVRERVLAVDAGKRSPRKTWPLIAAMSVLGLIALAVIAFVSTGKPPAGEPRRGDLVEFPDKEIPRPLPRVEPGAGDQTSERRQASQSPLTSRRSRLRHAFQDARPRHRPTRSGRRKRRA